MDKDNFDSKLVYFLDPATGKELRFVTNAGHLDAKPLTELHQKRWQIELFFRWIKQNLQTKTIQDTWRNAVLTQVWIALCAYLLLAFLKFKAKIDLSTQQMTRLLQFNLFKRRDLLDLLKPSEPQLFECRQFFSFKNDETAMGQRLQKQKNCCKSLPRDC